MIHAATTPTPFGDLALVTTSDGVVRAAGFGPLGALIARWQGPVGATRAPEVVGVVNPTELPESLTGALQRFADGDVGALDTVPVQQPGGEFFQAAWSAMRSVPPGTTITYSELATMAGRPAAIRAAGTACARNLVAPFVPCHRIVRTDGTLGGYAYGLRVKQALLAHERAAQATPAPHATHVTL